MKDTLTNFLTILKVCNIYLLFYKLNLSAQVRFQPWLYLPVRAMVTNVGSVDIPVAIGLPVSHNVAHRTVAMMATITGLVTLTSHHDHLSLIMIITVVIIDGLKTK